jgi:hypothetical protein
MWRKKHVIYVLLYLANQKKIIDQKRMKAATIFPTRTNIPNGKGKRAIDPMNLQKQVIGLSCRKLDFTVLCDKKPNQNYLDLLQCTFSLGHSKRTME